MPTFDNDAGVIWLGKPNPFPKGSDPWKRTEIVRKASGQTVGAICAKPGLRPSTLATLVGKRLIEIEGYKGRATEEEINELRAGLASICYEMHPITVRGVFYQATVRGLVEKEETGYDKVQNLLAKMRRDGKDFLTGIPGRSDFATAAVLSGTALPWEWIVDNTRGRDKPYVLNDVRHALEDAVRTYRKALWTDINAHVEIWLEKDALAGVIEEVTQKYDVSLMVARGYSSITFLHDAAEVIEQKNCPVYIYHLGDFDPSGVDAGEKIKEFLEEYAPTVDITFTRLAVTEEQIEQWHLPTRPTKLSDSRAASFGSRISVELDAIDPRQLRSLVERAIRKHLPKKRYDELMKQEAEEKAKLAELIEQLDLEDDA